MPQELFPFKYFDKMRGRWVNALYKASLEVIAATYEKWETTGPGWTPPDVDGRHKPKSPEDR